MNLVNAKLFTYENSCMSLSCHGSIEIKNGIISEINFKGYPRTYGDGWTRFYKNAKIGNKITEEQIKSILSCNGNYNVVSKLEVL